MEAEQYVDAYRRYREKLPKVGLTIPLMPFDWVQTPESVEARWWAYVTYLGDHARELSNDINRFRASILKMSAWALVLPDFEGVDEYQLIHEFVYPLTTIALNYPYAIRSRFLFSAAHLSHQANRVRELSWEDRFPDDESVDFNVFDKYARNWKGYSRLKRDLEKISNRSFREETKDYRNMFHHRYPPNIEVGISVGVKRYPNRGGRVSYGFGGEQPLKLAEIVPALTAEHQACSNCYTSYQELVNEQLHAIFGT